MARNMSFTLTTEQIRIQAKTVTRRLGWKFLKPGDTLNACVKCQGLKRGEKIERICKIRVVSINREILSDITDLEVNLEGFRGFSRSGFIYMFCRANHCYPDQMVTRIKFEYI